MKKAVILGASGLVGSFLLSELLAAEDIAEVHSFARSPLAIEHPKLREHLGDLLSEEFWQIKLQVDLVFICVGTTKAKTPNQELYRKIDHGIPLQAGKWALANGSPRLFIISSLGADAKSTNFYLRTKGQMEEEVLDLGLDSVILQPSMILGPRKEKRFFEAAGRFLFKTLAPLIPRNYRGVEAEDIAKAMFRLSKASKVPQRIQSSEIPALAQD